jgi:SAM-dependent methyltransferase
MGSSEIQGKLWGHAAREWAELQEAVCRPLYEHAFAATKVDKGTRYLDVGCGAGLALEMAQKRGAVVAGLDASPALLEVARRRLPGVELQEGDLESLSWGDGSFDVVTGFNSFQYASSPATALRQAARVTKAGGFVVVATWSPPDRTQAAAVLGALKPLMPPPPPGVTPPGPFALSDEAALKALAAEAGLTPVSMHDVECPLSYPNVTVAVTALASSGPAARAIEHSGRAAVDDAHKAVAEKFRRDDGSVFIPNAFRYLLTRRA